MMSKDSDVIVVGSGLGGLTTAALLSKQGLSVTLFERNSEIGGYLSSFKIKDFQFDIGAQDITFIGERGRMIIQKLGVAKNFIAMEPHCKIIFPDYEFYWASEEATKNYFISKFPKEKDGLIKLFEQLEKIYNETDRFVHSIDAMNNLESYACLAEYYSYSTQQLLDKFLKSAQLKSLLAAPCMFYQGSPPSRLSALHYADFMMCYFKNGSFLHLGGSHSFAENLKNVIEKNGGTIKTQSEITKILLKDGQAIGVVTADGTEFYSKYVVSNIDALTTFSKLVGYENLNPIFVTKLKVAQISLSRCQMYLGIKSDIQDTQFVTFYKDEYDPEKEFELSKNNQPVSIRCFIPTIVDSSIALPGYHCLSIAVVASYVEWLKIFNQGQEVYSEQKEKLMERIETFLKRMYPFFSGSEVVVRSMHTPVDLYNIALNNNGALYGWELTPNQSGIKRLSPVTPINHLLLAGQWTIPGGSVASVLRSADMAARKISEEEGLLYE